MFAGLPAALLLMFGAGVSLGMGTQALALFVNSRSRRNFGFNLLLSGAVYVLVWVAWSVSIWLLAGYLLPDRPPLETAIGAVALGVLPYLFGFLVLVPYLGPGIHRVLTALSLLGVVTNVGVTAGAGSGAAAPWRVILVAGGGWLLILFVHRGLNRPVAILGRRVRGMGDIALEQRLDIDDLPRLSGEVGGR